VLVRSKGCSQKGEKGGGMDRKTSKKGRKRKKRPWEGGIQYFGFPNTPWKC
jgi:hypothetical protein